MWTQTPFDVTFQFPLLLQPSRSGNVCVQTYQGEETLLLVFMVLFDKETGERV